MAVWLKCKNTQLKVLRNTQVSHKNCVYGHASVVSVFKYYQKQRQTGNESVLKLGNGENERL